MQSAPEFWNGIWFNRTGGIRVYSEMGLLFVLTVFGGLLLLFKTVFNGAKRKEEISVHLAQVEVRIGESVMVCTGLVDTGNQLYDPLTRTPVMVMEAGEWGTSCHPVG
ncbi:sigma-E processing peptidase SpoIIGA [Paenibacillus larvae]|nr:sigma-E processing peptidase SpoIIGA [Paenibacillus larvae]MDT2294998.1 sigma-E processing peptidase SpoIIGA [Paenibacillus larvae]